MQVQSINTQCYKTSLFKWKVRESSPRIKGMSKVFRRCVFTVHGTHVPRLSKQLSDGTKVLQAAEKHSDGDRGTRAPLPYITTKKPLHCSKTYLWLSLDMAACGVAGQKEQPLSSGRTEVAVQPFEYCTNSQHWKDDMRQHLLKVVSECYKAWNSQVYGCSQLIDYQLRIQLI